MIQPREDTQRSLKRMLANGPLTGVPKRPSDQQLLVSLAAAQLDPGKTYTEAELNEALKAWLATFCEPYGIDHVTLRRMLVDSRLVERTKSGSTYRVDREKLGRAPDLAAIDLAKVLAELRSERETRKQRHAD
jgi:hypothetical protein